MKVYCTRDAIGMADDMVDDDKSLSIDFNGQDTKNLIEVILKSPKFLAFASDTGYKVLFHKKQIAKIEKQNVQLAADAPATIDQLPLTEGVLRLEFLHYTGVK